MQTMAITEIGRMMRMGKRTKKRRRGGRRRRKVGRRRRKSVGKGIKNEGRRRNLMIEKVITYCYRLNGEIEHFDSYILYFQIENGNKRNGDQMIKESSTAFLIRLYVPVSSPIPVLSPLLT